MVAHITYLSEQALTRKFGRRLSDASSLTLLDDRFEVESYLQYQGSAFVRRFDANSYLSITRAMDFFDLAAEHGGDLSRAFLGARARASASSPSPPTGCFPPPPAATSSTRSSGSPPM